MTMEWEVNCPKCGVFVQIQKLEPVLCPMCLCSDIDVVQLEWINLSKPNEDILRAISEVMSSLEDAQRAVLRGEDSFSLVDDAWNALNSLHSKMDEGVIQTKGN